VIGRFREELRKAAIGAVCRTVRDFENRPDPVYYIRRIIPGGQAAFDVGTNIAEFIERVVCPVDSGIGSGIVTLPRDTAGFCETDYKVGISTRIRRANGSEFQVGSEGVPSYVSGTEDGPIGEFQLLEEERNTAGTLIVRAKWGVTTGTEPRVLLNLTNLGAELPTFLFLNVWIKRDDDLEDNCGPANTDGLGRFSDSITYEVNNSVDNSTTEVTENFTIDLGTPTINLDGSVVIPFAYISPTLDIRPALDITAEPELIFNYKPDNGPTLDDPDTDNVAPETPTAPLTNSRFVGVIVKSTQAALSTTTTTITDGDLPSFIFPRICSICFALEISGARCWSDIIDVNVTNQFIPVPGEFAGYGWEVKQSVGWTTEVIPIFINQDNESVL